MEKEHILELSNVELKLLRNILSHTNYDEATKLIGLTANGVDVQLDLSRKDLEPIMDKLMERMDKIIEGKNE